jgi:hypothetical protein
MTKQVPVWDHTTQKFPSEIETHYNGQADVYDDFSTKSNGQPTTTDSGATWRYIQTAASGSAMTVVSGLLTNTAVASGAAAGYAEVALSGNVNRIGADFRMVGGSTTNGVLTMGIEQASIVSTYPSIPAMRCHFWITKNNWALAIWPSQGAGAEVILSQGSLAFTLLDATTYRVEIVIDNDTAYLLLPDGSTAIVTDSRINSLAGPYAFWEVFAQSADTDAKAKIRRVWASADLSPIYADSPIPRLAQVPQTFTSLVKVATADAGYSAPAAYAPAEMTSVLRQVFVVPASGSVVQRLTAWAGQSASVGYYWAPQITDYAGASLRAPLVQIFNVPNAGEWVTIEYVHTGLTPGMQCQARWEHCSGGTLGQGWVTVEGGTGRQATMTVTPLPA